MSDKIRLAGRLCSSLVNGQGFRIVLFAQGCHHNCVGCFNKHTHSFDGGEVFTVDEVIDYIKSVTSPLVYNLTLSGGDVFYQAKGFSILLKKLKENDSIKRNIWCYTGFTFEELLNDNYNEYYLELLKNVDVLVDGKFEIDNKDTECKYKGSKNQRIIDVKESLKLNKVVLLKEY